MNRRVDRLTELLVNLDRNADRTAFSENDIGFLARAASVEIAIAQQNVLAAGLGASELWRLWCRNSDILPDQSAKLKRELPPNHILQKVLAEHDMVLCFISDLDDINGRIQGLTYASSTTDEIRRLAHIARHLISSEQHREREEEIIFPELVKRGYSGLLGVVTEQHGKISRRHHRLNELVYSVDSINFDDFKSRLDELVGYLIPAMRIHIFIETNIVFPLAIELVKQDRTWRRIKEVSEQIGYCGYDAE